MKVAAAQMACSRHIEDNVATMIDLIRSAAEQKADVVAFPELALTGALDQDLATVKQSDVIAAVHRLKQAAMASRIYVVFGLPWSEGTKRFNSAIVLSPGGEQLTRYDQLVVDRPDLF